jgi:hypothetical protein
MQVVINPATVQRMCSTEGSSPNSETAASTLDLLVQVCSYPLGLLFKSSYVLCLKFVADEVFY